MAISQYFDLNPIRDLIGLTSHVVLNTIICRLQMGAGRNRQRGRKSIGVFEGKWHCVGRLMSVCVTKKSVKMSHITHWDVWYSTLHQRTFRLFSCFCLSTLPNVIELTLSELCFWHIRCSSAVSGVNIKRILKGVFYHSNRGWNFELRERWTCTKAPSI